SRVYTTVLQYLRRGSKGFGYDHLGARPAYPLECFAVLEEHRDFEHVGFHWHLLVKGVDYLPKQTVSNALSSATNGRSYIVHVDGSEIAIDQAASTDVQEVMSVEGDDQPGEIEHEGKRSTWVLYEQEPFSSDIEDYRARRQLALVESLAAMQAGKPMYSRRVVSIWAYQRGLARTGKEYGKTLIS